MCPATSIYVLCTVVCDIRVLVAPAVFVCYYYYCIRVLMLVYTRVYVRSTAMGLPGLTKDYLRIVLGGQVGLLVQEFTYFTSTTVYLLY
jgi:hypothetical protein